METRSQLLATLVVERLVKEGLVSPREKQRLRESLASGKTTAEDWRLAVELAGDPAGKQ